MSTEERTLYTDINFVKKSLLHLRTPKKWCNGFIMVVYIYHTIFEEISRTGQYISILLNFNKLYFSIYIFQN